MIIQKNVRFLWFQPFGILQTSLTRLFFVEDSTHVLENIAMKILSYFALRKFLPTFALRKFFPTFALRKFFV